MIRISLPKSIPITRAVPVVAVLAVVQLVEGTSLVTAATFAAFLLVIVAAFNTAGGMIYPSGSYIFALTILGGGLGGFVKTILGEPLDSNLRNGQKTLTVYLVGTCALWAAAALNRRLRVKKPLLRNVKLSDRVSQIGIGCFLLGQYAGIVIPLEYMSTFNQFNNFLPLGILILAYENVRASGGKRSFSILAFALWAYVTVFWGLVSFSKQAIFTPSVVWAIGAATAGYWITVKRAVVVGVIAILAVSILTPYSQMGRIYRGDPEQYQRMWDLISHPLETRAAYEEQQRFTQGAGNDYHWFDKPQGLLDRLTMVPIDDALIAYTDEGHSETILPIVQYAVNMVPRYLVGQKETLHWGNRYAHEIGMLGKNDDQTGVSFSPFSDAYHCVQWWGITVVAMPAFLLMFWVCDSVTGSTEDSFWAVMYIMYFSHYGPEGLMNAPFAAASTLTFGVIFAAYTSKYVLPFIGGLVFARKPSIQMPQAAPVTSAPGWSTPR